MDLLEVVESLETIPLTREVETIKGLDGFEQQDVPVWNNLTGYLGYIEIDDDTYNNVLKAFLILGDEWYLVIVTSLACGGSKYDILEIDDITSIDGGGFGPLMTSLTIDVPLSLVYSDAFNLTGELTDEDDNAISGAMVKLVIGNTVVDSKITNSSGVASFTQTPVHMGIHTFKLVYEGSDAYRNCQSSTVTRDINKETSVLNVTSPLNNTSVYTDGSLSIAGTLLTDDAEVMASESIVVQQGDDTLTTLTTDSNGAFSGTVAASSLSTGNLVIKFETTTTHTASTATIAIVVSDPSLALTSDKSILSYADSESATLTATYTGTTAAGHTVYLYKQDGATPDPSSDTLIGSMTDGGDGTYTKSYASSGSGDVIFYAKSGTLLSETYTIEDCIDYDPTTSDKSSKFGSSITLRNTITASVTYDSTNHKYTISNNSSGGEAFIPINSATGLDDIIIEYDALFAEISNFIGLTTYKDNNNWSRLGLKSDLPNLVFEQGKKVSGSYTESDISSSTITQNTWAHNKYTITNNTVKRQIYNGDTLLYEDTTSYDSSWFDSTTKYGFPSLWASSWYGYFKNLKIKPL